VSWSRFTRDGRGLSRRRFTRDGYGLSRSRFTLDGSGLSRSRLGLLARNAEGATHGVSRSLDLFGVPAAGLLVDDASELVETLLGLLGMALDEVLDLAEHTAVAAHSGLLSCLT